MPIRHTMKGRTVLTAVAITTGLVLTAAGCGGGGGDDKSDKGTSPSATAKESKSSSGSEASQTPKEEKVLAEFKQGDISLVITSAVRDPGGFVTVSGKVTNGGSRLWSASDWRGDEKELSKNASSVAGASLVDKTGKKKYLILRDTEGRCLCTRFEGGLKSGETEDWYAQFPAPPEDTANVEFNVGSMPPATVPLTEGE